MKNRGIKRLAALLLTALTMTLIFFGSIRGIGVGTLVMTAFNGAIISLFSKLLDRYFEFPPLWPKAEALFRIE